MSEQNEKRVLLNISEDTYIYVRAALKHMTYSLTRPDLNRGFQAAYDEVCAQVKLPPKASEGDSHAPR